MSVPRKHHYLPQHYLRNFGNRRGHICGFDTQTGSFFSCSVKDAGAERDFYSTMSAEGEIDHSSLEQKFSSEIEDLTAPVLDKVVQSVGISKREKEILCRFVGSQIVRVPDSYERVKRRVPEVGEKVLRRQVERIVANADLSPAQKSQSIEIVQLVKEDFEADPPKELLFPLSDSQVVALLMRMQFTFARVPWGFCLVTSDNPVVFDRAAGLSRSNFSFALSSRLALVGSHEARLEDLGCLDVPSSKARELNLRSVNQATQFVYSERKQSWLPGALRKRKPVEARFSVRE